MGVGDGVREGSFVACVKVLSPRFATMPVTEATNRTPLGWSLHDLVGRPVRNCMQCRVESFSTLWGVHMYDQGPEEIVFTDPS